METNSSIVNINTDFVSYRLDEQIMVEYYNLKPGTKKKKKVHRKIVHKIKDILPSYMPRN